MSSELHRCEKRDDAPVIRDERERAISELTSELGELAARMRRLKSEQAELMSPGLLPGAYLVFSVLSRYEPLSPSTLVHSLSSDKAQVSRALADLEKRGFVSRMPDPRDRRAQLVSTTELGRERFEAAKAPYRQSYLSRLSEWDLDEINQFGAYLRRLNTGEARA